MLKADKLNYTPIRSIKELKGPSYEEVSKDHGKTVLFLDQVTDPQNFGSILRSAMFIGVDAIVVNKLNSCGLTPVVSRVSSGALEFTELYQVKFVSNFLLEARKLGWNIVSTNLSEEPSDLPSEETTDEANT